MPTFSQLTTLRLGGDISSFTVIHTFSELHDFFRDEPTAQESFVLGGGSNIVVSDHPIKQPIIQLSDQNLQVKYTSNGRAYAEIAAGLTLDTAISELLTQGWGGIELLSGIPGTCGGAVVQNVGAYGIEIAALLKRVQIFDRQNCVLSWWEIPALAYSYRNSLLKNSSRYIVISLELWLNPAGESHAITFTELAQLLEIPPGTVVNSITVRSAVISLRRQKGMVLEAADHDTWSVGSFFINPTLSDLDYRKLQEQLSTSIPAYPQASRRVKIPAAWLIEQAGFHKGYPGGSAGVWLSTKHTLALSNRGTGTTEELLELAREIHQGVKELSGLALVPEPIFVECQL